MDNKTTQQLMNTFYSIWYKKTFDKSKVDDMVQESFMGILTYKNKEELLFLEGFDNDEYIKRCIQIGMSYTKGNLPTRKTSTTYKNNKYTNFRNPQKNFENEIEILREVNE